MRYFLTVLGLLIVFVGLTPMLDGHGDIRMLGAIMVSSGVIVFAIGLATIDIVAAIKGIKPPQSPVANKEE